MPPHEVRTNFEATKSFDKPYFPSMYDEKVGKVSAQFKTIKVDYSSKVTETHFKLLTSFYQPREDLILQLKDESRTKRKQGSSQSFQKQSGSFIKFVDNNNLKSHQHDHYLKPTKSSMKKDPSAFHSAISNSMEDHNDVKELRNDSKRVSFSTLEIREYNITIGDNPGGSSTVGTPISIGWEFDHNNVQLHDLERFEKSRGSRRSKYYLCLPADVRIQRLSKVGFSQQEIDQAEKEVEKIRIQRNKTNLLNSFTTIQMQQVIRCTHKTWKRFTLQQLKCSKHPGRTAKS